MSLFSKLFLFPIWRDKKISFPFIVCLYYTFREINVSDVVKSVFLPPSLFAMKKCLSYSFGEIKISTLVWIKTFISYSFKKIKISNLVWNKILLSLLLSDRLAPLEWRLKDFSLKHLERLQSLLSSGLQDISLILLKRLPVLRDFSLILLERLSHLLLLLLRIFLILGDKVL